MCNNLRCVDAHEAAQAVLRQKMGGGRVVNIIFRAKRNFGVSVGWSRHLAASLMSVLLAACGGGGGSGSPLSISLTPSTVSASFVQGTVYSFTESAVVKGTVSGAVYVLIVDTAGVLQPNVSIQQQSATLYSASLATTPDLAEGTHSGSIQVKLCSDTACSTQYGGTSLPYTLTVLPPPTIAALSPSSVNAGGAPFTLTVDGANFNSTAVVQWNGAARSTAYVSSSRLTAQIGAADIADGGQFAVTVADPATGATSTAATFTVLNPQPAMGNVSPSTIATGTPGAQITVNGSGFVPSSSVQWNGVGRPSTFVSPTQLSAQISAADLANGGSASVTVVNPAPGGGSTASTKVTIRNPAPAPVVLNANTSAAGCAAFTLYVVGNGFVPNSSVLWSGQSRATSFVSSTLLTATISAADVAAPGSASVTIFSPAPGGGTSTPLTFSITASGAPTTDAVAFQIDPGHSGSATTECPLTLPAAAAWSTTLSGTPSYPLIAQGRVYATVEGGGSNSLQALDQATGNILWGPVAINAHGTAYDAGLLFDVGCNADCSGFAIQAHDGATGAIKWYAAVPGGQYSFTTGVTATGGMVYTGGSGEGGTIYGFSESSQSDVWETSVQNGDYSTPAVTADGVYMDYPCRVYSLTQGSGGYNWEYATGCEGGGGATVAAGGGVVLAALGSGDMSGSIFDAKTGQILRSYSAEFLPAISAPYYFTNTGVGLKGYRISDGALLWSFTGDGSLATSPIVVNQTVFIGSYTGTLFAVDAATGQLLWQIATGTPFTNGVTYNSAYAPALAAGDGLLVAPIGNSLKAYRISSGP
jgi:outer membrane protein assembly factor BamB